MITVANQRNTPIQKGWWLADPASDRKAFGVVLHQKNGIWTVARTLKGSPAEKSAVVAGEEFIAVDGYEVSHGKGDIHEMHHLMMLDTSVLHEITFRTASTEVKRKIEKASLRQLLELDFDSGGALDGYCVGCRTCRPLSIGASDCSSGCPGNYCTVG